MIEKETVAKLHLSNKVVVSLNIDNPHTYFGVPHNTSSSLELISQMNDCDYKEEIYYLNYSARPITIINRNGLTVTVKDKVSIGTRDIIIRKVISFNNFSLKSAIAAIQMNTDIDDVELVEIRKAFSTLDHPDIRKASVMIDYRITADELRDKGNTIYHYQTDLLLTYNGNTSTIGHPHCARFLNINSFGNTNDYSDQREFNFKLRYVNHERNAQPLYMCVLGKIHLIKPQKDAPVRNIRVKDNTGKFVNKTFGNYIQLFYNSQSDPDLVNPVGLTHVKYSLEEAKLKFGLYETYAEAINSKSTDLVRKEELVKLAHQLELIKHQNVLDKIDAETKLENIRNENNIRKQELDREALVLKSKQSVLDTEVLGLENQKRLLELSRKQMEDTMAQDNKRFEETLRKVRAENEAALNEEVQRTKEARENKQHARRETIDMIKFIPATIIGIGAIAALIVKLQQPKTQSP